MFSTINWLLSSLDFLSNGSYFELLNLSFIENYHIIIFTAFAKQSMINQLSNPINRNRSAAKISKVMSSSARTSFRPIFGQKYLVVMPTIWLLYHYVFLALLQLFRFIGVTWTFETVSVENWIKCILWEIPGVFRVREMTLFAFGRSILFISNNSGCIQLFGWLSIVSLRSD